LNNKNATSISNSVHNGSVNREIEAVGVSNNNTRKLCNYKLKSMFSFRSSIDISAGSENNNNQNNDCVRNSVRRNGINNPYHIPLEREKRTDSVTSLNKNHDLKPLKHFSIEANQNSRFKKLVKKLLVDTGNPY
jgi:hypothetical protein